MLIVYRSGRSFDDQNFDATNDEHVKKIDEKFKKFGGSFDAKREAEWPLLFIQKQAGAYKRFYRKPLFTFSN